MFPYPVVESGLVSFFEVKRSTGLLAFRARIRNLQRLGLASAAPGRGKRLQYSFEDVCDLALALSLADLGVDPSKIVEQVWSGTIRSLKAADMYCVYIPLFYTKGSSRLAFCDKKLLQKMLGQLPRMGVVNVEDLKTRIKRELISAAEPW